MFALFRKELYVFFNSAIGYVVIGIYLLIMGLFLWFLPTQFNILNTGIADFEPMFILAPWIFLFLVPAITMHLIVGEKRLGTLELLITKPLSEFQIVLAKYFAALVIILIALVPTLVYYVIVQYFLSNHSVDPGAFWGSFVGLFLLASVYAAIGIFASSIAVNQVVAFVLGIVLAIVFYLGLGLVSKLSFLNSVSGFIAYLGIDYHYQSISRGVLDTRDLIYFISLIALFIYLTVLKLKSRT